MKLNQLNAYLDYLRFWPKLKVRMRTNSFFDVEDYSKKWNTNAIHTLLYYLDFNV